MGNAEMADSGGEITFHDRLRGSCSQADQELALCASMNPRIQVEVFRG
jgi:hypothetical protein